MTGSIRTLSNALSLLRILLVVPISAMLMLDTAAGRSIAMALIFIAGLTDFLDGYVARKKGEITDLGKILDPVADKTAIAAVGVVLASQGRVPVWFLLAVVARDVLILAGGLFLRRKRSILLQSNRLGKWTAGVLALTLCAAVADPGSSGPVVQGLLGLSMVMAAASLVSYGARFVSALAGNPAHL
jgi:cardiolipin synthase